MPVLQHTRDRLRLACIGLRHAGAFVNLDRSRNRAEIYRLALIVPFERRCAALSDVVDVLVRKREYGEHGATYTSVLRLDRGDSISIPCRSRDEAMSSMRLVRKFLKLE